MSAAEYLVQGALRLEQGSAVLIDDGREMLVYVWEGCVWATEEGERRDRVLSTGDWMRVTRDGRTVISALKPSSIALTSPFEEEPAAAISIRRPGSEQTVQLHARQPGPIAAFVGWVREMLAYRPRRVALQ